MGRFGGTGRHFWLDSWILANLVQLGTQRFCKQFLNRTNDPAGRQFDQMTQAARSGCANNAEGVMRKRKAKSGKNAGQEFWGCSKFPACNGVRSL